MATSDPASDPGDPPPWQPRSLLERLKKPLATAWFASAILHMVLLLLAALITIGGGQAGGARPESDTIGIAVLTEAEFGQISDAALDQTTPTVTDALEDPLAVQVDLQIPATVTAFDDPLDLARAASELTAGLGAGDLSGGALGGAGGAASFFGIEAKGTRFAYIVDISGSMDVGIGSSNITRMDVLKRELQASIASLNENSRFIVILFSHQTRPLGGRLQWTDASDAGKDWGRTAVAAIRAEGGTEPVPAFEMIFSVRPRPDAIYFMTDGEFDYDAPRQIALLNGDLRIPIHAICFDSREGEEQMLKIAQDSGGTYNFVSGAGR